MPFQTHRLPNGLTIIGETSPSAKSVAVGFFVRTGARDETPPESGVSHFLEHMMFKGTPRRSAEQVNLDFDRIGSLPNAWTSEENTLYHAAVLPEYLPRVMDILSDILRPSLRPEDFDTEKKVILEEILRYQDQPGAVAGEHARAIFYGPHPLGNSVLGTSKSVAALTRDQMHAYFTRRYAANNVILAAAGKFEFAELIRLAEAACSGWNTAETGRTHRTESVGPGGIHVLTRDTVQQQHLLLMAAGPPADSRLRCAADTLAVALGDDSGSRLYWELIDPGLADTADSSFSENDASGMAATYVTCEPENADSNLAIVRKMLGEVQRDSITPDELRLAKTKLTSRVVRGGERPMGRMQSIAWVWATVGEYRDVDTELANYDAVTMADVRDYLDRYPIDRTTVVAFGPAKSIDGVEGKVV